MNRQQRLQQAQLGGASVANRCFAEAVSHYRGGNLAQAMTAGLQALNIEPENAEILHLVGVVSCQLGEKEKSITYLSKAVRIKPTFAEAQFNFGLALLDAGNLKEALCAFDSALIAKAEFGEALDWRGVALQRLGRHVDALADHSRACALMPSSATAWSNLAAAYLGVKHYGEAETASRRALALMPTYARSQIHLGLALAGLGRIVEAETVLREAAARSPKSDAYYNLGCLLSNTNRLEAAIEEYRASISARPDHSLSYNNLGVSLRSLNRIDEAETALQYSLALAPDVAETHFNLALLLLVTGRLLPGWEEYEWRRRMKSWMSIGLPRSGPSWFGQRQVSVLIHAEQGLGDSIQFVRYLPQVAALGVEITLEIQQELLPLLDGFPGVAKLIRRGQFSEYDFHCPLLSLPRIFGTTLDTIPADIPYIRAPEYGLELWRAKLSSFPRMRVGVVWAGGAANPNDSKRSLSAQQFDPLLARAGITWFSLQKGSAADQARPGMIDLAPDLITFGDTAAAIAHLDLIISVDTSVAHLAGAMGKPVWVLLPFSPDWRWMLDRMDSPWYPSMRLFRQPTPGDWDSVIKRVNVELSRLTNCGRTFVIRPPSTLS